jgi:hypothetical protein
MSESVEYMEVPEKSKFISEKEKLSKGCGYPLKSSVLAKALEEGGVPFGVQLVQGHRGPSIGVEFWPPNPNVHYERLYITSGWMKSAEVHAAREYLETVAIPELVSWAQGIASLPLNSPVRREKQRFGRDIPQLTTS